MGGGLGKLLGQDEEFLPNPLHQVFQCDLQGFGDPGQGADARGFFTAFHLPEVDRMQVRFFRQPLLRQLQRLAMPPDILTDDLLV